MNTLALELERLVTDANATIELKNDPSTDGFVDELRKTYARYPNCRNVVVQKLSDEKIEVSDTSLHVLEVVDGVWTLAHSRSTTGVLKTPGAIAPILAAP